MLRIHGPGLSDDNGSDSDSSDPRPDAPGAGGVAVATIGWCCCTGSNANVGMMAPRSAVAAALVGAVSLMKRRTISMNFAGSWYTDIVDCGASVDTPGAGGDDGVRSMDAAYDPVKLTHSTGKPAPIEKVLSSFSVSQRK
jgi:hypothetical protein